MKKNKLMSYLALGIVFALFNVRSIALAEEYLSIDELSLK